MQSLYQNMRRRTFVFEEFRGERLESFQCHYVRKQHNAVVVVGAAGGPGVLGCVAAALLAVHDAAKCWLILYC